MADNEQELAEEVRQYTGYTSTSTISDADLHALIDLGKEELRAEFGSPNFSFFQESSPNTHAADRSLFWFTCIATKVRFGELGGISLSINDMESTQPNEYGYDFWFRMLNRHLTNARTQFSEESGAASRTLERDDRTYEYELP